MFLLRVLELAWTLLPREWQDRVAVLLTARKQLERMPVLMGFFLLL